MKKNHVFLLFLAFSFFTSCSTENPEEFIEATTNRNCIEASYDLGFQNFQEGCLHNIVAINFIENWDICPSSSTVITSEFNEISSLVSTQIQTQFSLTSSEINDIMELVDFEQVANNVYSNPNYWSTEINNSPFSSTLKSLMLNLNSVVNNITQTEWDNTTDSEGVQLVNSKYFAYYNANLNSLSDAREKILFGTFIDVAMSSNYLWTPIEFGGLGYYETFGNQLDNLCVSSRPRGWWKDLKDWYHSSSFGDFVATDAVATVATTGAVLISTAGAGALPLCGGIPCAGAAGVVTGAGASIIQAIND